MRDNQTNEVYLPLTSTVVLKRKQEMLYVPLGFENNLKKRCFDKLKSNISGVAQNDLDTINSKPQIIFPKSKTFPIFE